MKTGITLNPGSFQHAGILLFISGNVSHSLYLKTGLYGPESEHLLLSSKNVIPVDQQFSKDGPWTGHHSRVPPRAC